MKTFSFRITMIAALLTAMSVSSKATASSGDRIQLSSLDSISQQSAYSEQMTSEGLQEEADEVSYKVSPSREVVMNLLGTTPIKDWTMRAHGLTGEATMVITKDNRLSAIHALTFSLPVYNLQGDERGMDEDAYRALKADRYRDIVFNLTSATIAPQGDHLYLISALGTLTVAGVTRTVTLQMHSRVTKDGTMICTGSEALKMSDYNVERPSILFGVIKAGDGIVLTFNLIFIK
jgi:polyisoprenoid-binding protein YceI